MVLGILKTTKIDVCLLGILIVSLAYQVRKNLFKSRESYYRILKAGQLSWQKANV
jgi:hypothetical protein